MGDQLNHVTMQALSDELEKIARFSGLKTIGRRIMNPKKGLQEGWRAFAPSNLMSMATDGGKELRQAVGKTHAAQGKKGIRAATRRTFGAGTHISDPGGGSVREMLKGKDLKGAAEELSRRGWTGQGRLTKYIPLGEKGQMGVWAGTTAPSLARAATGTQREGEVGLGEQVGEQAGWIAPSILAAGVGGLGAMTIPLVGSALAARAGKALDRKVGRP